jgi:hypothetical protein
MSYGRLRRGLQDIEMRFRLNGFCVNHNKYSVQEKRNAIKFLAGKPEGKRPLGRPSHRWENNIKRDLNEIG